MRIYIAGGMRGYKWYNFPAFDEAEAKLKKQGWETVNPAQIDRDNGFDPKDLPEDYDWSKEPIGMDVKAVIRRDLDALQNCHAIYLLRGWEKSIGARAEKAVAEWLGLEIIYEELEKN